MSDDFWRIFCQRGGHASRDRVQTFPMSNTFAGALFCHQLQLEITSLQLFLDTDFRSQCWAEKWGMRAFPELAGSHFPVCRCRTLFLCCDYSGWHCTPTICIAVTQRHWRNTWDWRSCNHSCTKVISGAAERQYLIHIPTSALHKHRSYQTILNQRNTYDHRFILKPQAHKTFIINSVFFGSSRIQPPLGTSAASPWHKQLKMSQPQQGKTGNLNIWRAPGLKERGAETSFMPIFKNNSFFPSNISFGIRTKWFSYL